MFAEVSLSRFQLSGCHREWTWPRSPHLIQGLNTGTSQPVVNPSSRHFAARNLTRKKSLGFLSTLLVGDLLKQLSSHELRHSHRVSVRNLSSLLTVCEQAAYEMADNEDEVTSQTGLLWTKVMVCIVT